ncbi:MAG TPA: iron-containing alcohol dehydrogenase [Pirellulales bacterium]|nr:iron-containing alcohol dehydrogenase [Pirellulales bacterium]
MSDIWSFHSAGQLVFGRGAIARAGQLVTRLGVRRVMVVTDQRLADAGIVDSVTVPLAAAGIDAPCFTGGEPEPTLEAAERAIAHARDVRPDAVLGLGGGSNMDLAKITAAVLAHGGRPRDFFGDDCLAGPVLPLICVPTTAGTGSEVSASCVLTDRQNEVKVGVLSNYLRPRLAIVDPLLTVSCPAKVTADSGIDALTHAIEAFTAVDNARFPLAPGEKTVYQGRHPLADALAEKAIRLIGQNLERAVSQPTDEAAREAMSLGATLAGMAFSNVGVALVHALEYPLGGLTHCSHGAGNGLFLPYVMRFNLPRRERELAQIATFLGIETQGKSERQAAEAAIERVEQIRLAIGIPARLRELGVTRERLPMLAEKTLAIKRILRVNPRAVTLVDLTSILESAL